MGYGSNNNGDDHLQTLVYFLSDSDEWRTYGDKWYHFTKKFNPEYGSSFALCESFQRISCNTWYSKVTLDEIELQIVTLQRRKLLLQISPSLCERCARKALMMKKTVDEKKKQQPA